MSVAAVVFDVDDTLVQTEAACFVMENEILAGLGHPPMSREVHRASWGRPLLEAMAVRCPGLDLDAFAAAHAMVLRRWVGSGRLDVLTRPTLDVLDRLLVDGRRILLLTSRTGSEVDHLARPGHPLGGRVERIYHADVTGVHKPDPAVFAPLLADTGLPPGRCVYVGDSPGDAAAATGAGLHFVASLESGLRHRADFAAWPVDGFVDTLAEVPALVARLDATRLR